MEKISVRNGRSRGLHGIQTGKRVCGRCFAVDRRPDIGKRRRPDRTEPPRGESGRVIEVEGGAAGGNGIARRARAKPRRQAATKAREASRTAFHKRTPQPEGRRLHARRARSLAYVARERGQMCVRSRRGTKEAAAGHSPSRLFTGGICAPGLRRHASLFAGRQNCIP